MTKLDIANWPQLDFLINNFYEIVEYKRGRGVYGDRIILKRYKDPKAIFGEPEKLCDFYYLDAHAVKELPMTVKLKIRNILRFVTSPADMNVLCDFTDKLDPTLWAEETRNLIANEFKSGIDFKKINDIVLSQYSKLPDDFNTKLQAHRRKQYQIAIGLDLLSTEHVEEELSNVNITEDVKTI